MRALGRKILIQYHMPCDASYAKNAAHWGQARSLACRARIAARPAAGASAGAGVAVAGAGAAGAGAAASEPGGRRGVVGALLRRRRAASSSEKLRQTVVARRCDFRRARRGGRRRRRFRDSVAARGRRRRLAAANSLASTQAMAPLDAPPRRRRQWLGPAAGGAAGAGGPAGPPRPWALALGPSSVTAFRPRSGARERCGAAHAMVLLAGQRRCGLLGRVGPPAPLPARRPLAPRGAAFWRRARPPSDASDLARPVSSSRSSLAERA